MSTPEPPRPPAWGGLLPRPDDFHPLDDAWSRRLQQAIGQVGQIRARPADRYDQREGFYQFIPNTRAGDLFLKVIPQHRLASQLQAERIVRWLHGQGLHVSRLLDGYPRPLDTQLQLLAYTLLDTRLARPQIADMDTLGRTLARLHAALRALPWATDIKAASTRRDTEFAALHARLLAQPATAAPLRKLLQHTGPSLPQAHGQPLHGDLNLGNVLIDRHAGHAIVLDLEDSLHNWHNPTVDLALCYERCVLVHCDDDAHALTLAQTLITAYRAHGGAVLAADWGGILRGLAVRALLLLEAQHDAGATPAAGEYAKFLALYAQTETRAALLNNVARHV